MTGCTYSGQVWTLTDGARGTQGWNVLEKISILLPMRCRNPNPSILWQGSLSIRLYKKYRWPVNTWKNGPEFLATRQMPVKTTQILSTSEITTIIKKLNTNKCCYGCGEKILLYHWWKYKVLYNQCKNQYGDCSESQLKIPLNAAHPQ